MADEKKSSLFDLGRIVLLLIVIAIMFAFFFGGNHTTAILVFVFAFAVVAFIIQMTILKKK